MKHIFELTDNELRTICEIVTEMKCPDEWDGRLKKFIKGTSGAHPKKDALTYNWKCSKTDSLYTILIYDNYDISIRSIGGSEHMSYRRTENIIKYAKFVKGIPDWMNDSEDLNLL